MNVIVDEEFKSLCPPLSTSERELLERSILVEGCRDPLIVWDGILIDGHNRLEICQRNSKPFDVRTLEFNSREEAREWILANQLGRRNLTEIQASYLRGCYYRMMRKSCGGWRGGRGSGEPPTQNVLAKKFSVSPSTIRADVWIADAIDRLSPASRAFVFDPDSVTRKQHVIDLSHLAEQSQAKVVKVAKEIGGEGLRKVMCKLRGTSKPGAHGVRCKRCGARLAPGIKTCLGCDLSERDIDVKLAEPIDDEPEDESWKDRLAALRAAKESNGGDVRFHVDALIQFVQTNEIRQNTIEHKALGKLLRVLRTKVGWKRFPKNYSSYDSGYSPGA